MESEIIPLHNDEHQDLRELLPWYVTGRLDGEEHVRVDAHVAACAECQAEVRFQRRLESEVARLPMDVEQSWSRMRKRLHAEAEAAKGGRRVMPVLRAGAPWLGWGIAAALLLTVGVSLAPSLLPASAEPSYHALGAAPVTTPGNLVVIFRPDATERQMREALTASGARIVDGPTPADGYVLRTPAALRPAALASLRARHEVVLAEPLDSAALR